MLSARHLAALVFGALSHLILAASALSQVNVEWDASAGIPPGSADPPWSLTTGTVGGASGPSQASVSFSPLGVVLSAAARPIDRASMGQDFLALAGPAPSIFVFEVEMALSQVVATGLPMEISASHPGLNGTWRLALSADQAALANLYVTPGPLGSPGLASDQVAIGSTGPLRTYRVEVDAAANFGTLFIDGVQALTVQGAPSPVLPQGHLGFQVQSVGSRLLVGRIEHNAGTDALSVCAAPLQPQLWFLGSAVLADGGAAFEVFPMPPSSIVVPVVSSVPAPPVSMGALRGMCIGRPLFRFLPGGQPLVASASGLVSLTVDPGSVPSSGGPRPLSAGESLYVQLWYRDPAVSSGGEFTSALRIEFR